MSTITDLTTMIGNLSRSVYPIQQLLGYFCYILGLVFIISAIVKFKKIGESRGRSQEKPFVAIAYFLGGAALFYLPSILTVFSNTTFGSGNILRYTNYNPYNIYTSMGLIIQLAGVIWFIRGCVLLVNASQPQSGEKHGAKGFAFLCAGILAINFRNTAAAINAAFEYLISVTSTFTKGK